MKDPFLKNSIIEQKNNLKLAQFIKEYYEDTLDIFGLAEEK